MAIAILNNGETQTQVGAVIVAENGRAIAKFSRSENGQQARRHFETGEDALSIAYLKRASGRQPAAFSLRAVDGKSIRESDMSAKEIVALGQAHNMTERAALAIAAGKTSRNFELKSLMQSQPAHSTLLRSTTEKRELIH